MKRVILSLVVPFLTVSQAFGETKINILLKECVNNSYSYFVQIDKIITKYIYLVKYYIVTLSFFAKTRCFKMVILSIL